MKTIVISITDPTPTAEIEMLDYIKSHRLSLVKVEEIDLSDFTMDIDTINDYHFSNEEDALLFKLRWKHGY